MECNNGKQVPKDIRSSLYEHVKLFQNSLEAKGTRIPTYWKAMPLDIMLPYRASIEGTFDLLRLCNITGSPTSFQKSKGNIKAEAAEDSDLDLERFSDNESGLDFDDDNNNTPNGFLPKKRHLTAGPSNAAEPPSKRRPTEATPAPTTTPSVAPQSVKSANRPKLTLANSLGFINTAVVVESSAEPATPTASSFHATTPITATTTVSAASTTETVATASTSPNPSPDSNTTLLPHPVKPFQYPSPLPFLLLPKRQLSVPYVENPSILVKPTLQELIARAICGREWIRTNTAGTKAQFDAYWSRPLSKRGKALKKQARLANKENRGRDDSQVV
ncbi:hypothetical protein ONZ45_g6340 [Pleurotus djamor]|nr:hypothetical protein ONZ45_g6340 [Pleurotus djamor]